MHSIPQDKNFSSKITGVFVAVGSGFLTAQIPSLKKHSEKTSYDNLIQYWSKALKFYDNHLTEISIETSAPFNAKYPCPTSIPEPCTEKWEGFSAELEACWKKQLEFAERAFFCFAKPGHQQQAEFKAFEKIGQKAKFIFTQEYTRESLKESLESFSFKIPETQEEYLYFISGTIFSCALIYCTNSLLKYYKQRNDFQEKQHGNFSTIKTRTEHLFKKIHSFSLPTTELFPTKEPLENKEESFSEELWDPQLFE